MAPEHTGKLGKPTSFYVSLKASVVIGRHGWRPSPIAHVPRLGRPIYPPCIGSCKLTQSASDGALTKKSRPQVPLQPCLRATDLKDCSKRPMTATITVRLEPQDPSKHGPTAPEIIQTSRRPLTAGSIFIDKDELKCHKDDEWQGFNARRQCRWAFMQATSAGGGSTALLETDRQSRNSRGLASPSVFTDTDVQPSRLSTSALASSPSTSFRKGRNQRNSQCKIGDKAASIDKMREAKENEEQSRKDYETFQTTLVAKLAALESSQARWACTQDEEVLFRALRSIDLDPVLRCRAALCLAQALARPGRGASKAEALELESELSHAEPCFFLERPNAAFELSQVCRGSLGLSNVANSICSLLAEEALNVPASANHPMPYILIDLAEWRKERGEVVEGRRLWQLARDMPETCRDPRTIARHYTWSFCNEPGSYIYAQNAHVTQRSDAALDMQVRREMVKHFNVAGSLIDLASGGSRAGCSKSTQRMMSAKAFARLNLDARRFEVQVIDTDDADDDVAKVLMRDQRTNQRTKVEQLVLSGEGSPSDDSQVEDVQEYHMKSKSTMSSCSSDQSDAYFSSEDDEDDEDELDDSFKKASHVVSRRGAMHDRDSKVLDRASRLADGFEQGATSWKVARVAKLMRAASRSCCPSVT